LPRTSLTRAPVTSYAVIANYNTTSLVKNFLGTASFFDHTRSAALQKWVASARWTNFWGRNAAFRELETATPAGTYWVDPAIGNEWGFRRRVRKAAFWKRDGIKELQSTRRGNHSSALCDRPSFILNCEEEPICQGTGEVQACRL
jgi:hypothetical protein